MILLSGPILLSLFQHGLFTVNDAAMARISLIAYAIGLPAFGYVKILAPGFFARHDTRTPVKIAVQSMLAKLVLNIALVIPLYMNGIAWAHAGLALATSLSAWLQTILLYRRLRLENAYQPESGRLKLLTRILIATTAMSVVLFFCNPALESWLAFSLWQRALTLGALIIPATFLFFTVMWLFGMRLHDFRNFH
jgi:putative peptidoglycan lipid II flippase